MRNDLVGKHFIEHGDKHENYRLGVIKAAADGAYLMAYDSWDDGGPTLMEVVLIEELTERTECCGCKRWNFFETRDELQAYLKWVDQSSEKDKDNKVVKLTKH